MKRVAIISRHAILNYGSLLQAYALEQTVRDLGYDARTIDYIRTEEKSWHLCKAELINSRWNSNLIKKAFYYAVNVPNRTIQFSIFQKYRHELLHLTQTYGSYEELKQSPPIADLYCTGSDQVWNETIYNKLDWSYFLTFLSNKPRIAYAASFGKDTIQQEEKEIVKAALEKYYKISIREKSGKEILSDLGLDGKVVLDPTLLLSREKWETLIGTSNHSQERYVLLYQIHKNNDLVEYARRLAEKKGYKVINISVSYTQKKKGICFSWLPHYRKVLGLFRDASYIVTDSFHATAFSINFNKQYVTVLPPLSAARIRSILSIMELEDRVLTNTTDFELPQKMINYASVNSILMKLRKESMDWLKNTLRETIGD